MINKRLFTFGCSFTRYKWPTWADIIGQSFDYHENWGMSGIGNRLISNKLLECHHLNNITKDDIVMVMFTSVPRLDFYNTHWSGRGNILNTKLAPYESMWIENNWSITQGYYDTWTSIKTVKLLLDSIGCEYKLFRAFNISPDLPSEYGRFLKPKTDGHFLKVYSDDIENYFSIKQPFYEVVSKRTDLYTFKKFTPFNSNEFIDLHPTVKHHEEWCVRHLSDYYTNKVDIEYLESKINFNDLSDNNPNNYLPFKMNYKFGILP